MIADVALLQVSGQWVGRRTTDRGRLVHGCDCGWLADVALLQVSGQWVGRRTTDRGRLVHGCDCGAGGRSLASSQWTVGRQAFY